MTDTKSLEDKLKTLSEKLRRRGHDDLAQDVGRIVEELDRNSANDAPVELITTGEAARALGVRSINTIKRWAKEGSLDAVRRGGRLMVSAESVRRMLESPTVAEQRAREARVATALEPFDQGDEEIPPISTWEGRKPWDARDRESA